MQKEKSISERVKNVWRQCLVELWIDDSPNINDAFNFASWGMGRNEARLVAEELEQEFGFDISGILDDEFEMPNSEFNKLFADGQGTVVDSIKFVEWKLASPSPQPDIAEAVDLVQPSNSIRPSSTGPVGDWVGRLRTVLKM